MRFGVVVVVVAVVFAVVFVVDVVVIVLVKFVNIVVLRGFVLISPRHLFFIMIQISHSRSP